MKTLFVLCSLGTCLLLAGCAPETDELTGVPTSGDKGRYMPPEEDPYQGSQEQVKGFYSKGSLISADNLGLEGFGWVKITRPRNRGFGSYDLTKVLQDTAAQLQQLYPSRDRIQVSDMSSEHGGDLSGHASHQNGLDADVAFIRLDQTEQDVEDTSGFKESFVVGGKLTANFDLARNWAYAKLLIDTGRVQRVFVGDVVKKGICAYVRSVNQFESGRETLKRLRVIDGHTDHFHVRVTCPNASPTCKTQEDPIENTGCPQVN